MAEGKEKRKEKRSGISRRDFIKGTGLAVGGVAISSTVLGVACNTPPAPPVSTPGANTTTTKPPTTTPSTNTSPPIPTPTQTTVTKAPEGVVALTVNNQKHVLEVQPEWSLAFVIREKLGLAGLKVACDRGECGSCNILVDGKLNLACSMLAIESEGKKIVTIEGLANGPTLHPVQQLFLDDQTFQCGYCTPAMILAAVAVQTKTPKPTADQIREGLAGTLCHCGDYTRILSTILKGGQ